MKELPNRPPDNRWFGRIESWEDRRFGYRALTERIIDPSTFRGTLNSAGDDEIIELVEPGPSDKLVLTYLDANGDSTGAEPTILDAENPTHILPGGTKYIMDSTQTTSKYLVYDCICFGEPALVE